MKRFHAREMALLLGPIALIGVVGFWASRRKPVIEDEPLHLTFKTEKPTTLEAFQGTDVIFVVELAGQDALWSQIYKIHPFLEVRTPQGIQFLHSTSPRWKRVWKKSFDDSYFLVDLDAIPLGQVHFAYDAQIGREQPSPILHRSGKWKINRAAIKPFDFENLPRAPLIEIESVTITDVKSNTAWADVVFSLQGAALGVETQLDSTFNEQRGRMSYGPPSPDLSVRQRARYRVSSWQINAPKLSSSIGKAPLYVVTGRASAGNRWPLAFQFQPFDLKTAKVGQKLKFKSWAAPLPSSTKPQ